MESTQNVFVLKMYNSQRTLQIYFIFNVRFFLYYFETQSLFFTIKLCVFSSFLSFCPTSMLYIFVSYQVQNVVQSKYSYKYL